MIVDTPIYTMDEGSSPSSKRPRYPSAGLSTATLAAAFDHKTRMLHQDRLTVETCLDTWVCAVKHAMALCDNHVAALTQTACAEDKAEDNPFERAAGLEKACAAAEQACADAIAVLDQEWSLQCGHPGAPWLTVV